MTRTNFGWLKKDDYIFTYLGGNNMDNKQAIIFRVDERIHDKEKKRLIFNVIIISCLTRKKLYKQPLKVELTEFHKVYRISKPCRNMKQYYKLTEDEILKHVLMENI